MFSVERIKGINRAFEARMPHYQAYGNQIVEQIMQCGEDEATLLKFLYATMPLSDGVNYDFEVFLDYARQAVLLRKESSYSQSLDEDIFLNYVVYHRINEEEISSCRSFFYGLLKDRIAGKSLVDATLEVNYWCSEEVTYQSTDERTASALTIFNGAYGRCGEESTFTVSALRSVGIPARQVYAPRWSHCDDNHAWVEVYMDNKWHFLGACEPEEVLNKGWFTNASSRAMLVHSRWFDTESASEEAIEQVGVATLLNNLELYAKTTQLTVEVRDESGHYAVDAEVDFEILNYAEFYPVAKVKVDGQGIARLTTGLGSMRVVAKAGDKWASQVIDARITNQVTLTLGETEVPNEWQMIDMIAPVDTPIHVVQLTPEQKAVGKDKFEAAAKKRLQKVDNFFKTWEDGNHTLIEEARANYIELQKFLED
ncbi:MAG: transglutaminase-like domain-containing protein, partial [Cellulosilyticaceae bacterium]